MKIKEWVGTFARANNLTAEKADMLLGAFDAVRNTAIDGYVDGLRCAFCNRPRSELRYIVQAESGVCICDECAADALQCVTDHITARAGL